MTYIINVIDRNSPIPFPKNAHKGDIAQVRFSTKTMLQLVHFYSYNGKTWRYTHFQLVDISANN